MSDDFDFNSMDNYLDDIYFDENYKGHDYGLDHVSLYMGEIVLTLFKLGILFFALIVSPIIGVYIAITENDCTLVGLSILIWSLIVLVIYLVKPWKKK